MAARKHKGRTFYTPENIDKICKLISETGLEGVSADAVVSSAAHQKWKKVHPEYKARVDEAMAEFHRKRFIDRTNAGTLSHEYLLKCLLGQQFETETIERTIEDPRGGVTRHTEIKTKQVRPPSWYLLRMLGDSTSKDFLIRIGLADPNRPELILERAGEEENEEQDEQDNYDDFDA